jgi:Spy/CpxP family protein refolding chaperone
MLKSRAGIAESSVAEMRGRGRAYHRHRALPTPKEVVMLTLPILFVALLIVTPAEDETSAPPPEKPLLAGPELEGENEQEPTLVSYTFDGELVDVGPEPDIAAIRLLDLSEAQSAAFESILTERRAQFDQLVSENYGVITELIGLASGGDDNDRRALVPLLRDLRQAFEPYFRRGSVLDEMSGHLTDAQVEQVRSLVRAYGRALLADLQRRYGKDSGPRRLRMRYRLETFGKLVRESIERQIDLEKEMFDQLLDRLDLTDEQRVKAQAIFGPLGVQRLQGNLTPEAQREAIAEFVKILTPKQRWELVKIRLGELRDAAGGDREESATEPTTRP